MRTRFLPRSALILLSLGPAALGGTTHQHPTESAQALKKEEEYLKTQNQFLKKVFEGDLEAVKTAVEREKIDPNGPREDGATALLIALQEGKIEIADYLMSLPNPKVNQSYLGGIFPLLLAVQNHSASGLKLLKRLLSFRDLNLNQATKSGRTALMLSVLLGNSAAMEELLKNGALEVDQKDQDGQSALALACEKGDLEAVQLLLKKGAHPNLRGKSDWTPLHYAVSKGHFKIVQALLRGGADPFLFNQLGYNAIHVAATAGNVEILEFLLTSPAPTSVLDLRTSKTLATPLFLASARNQLEAVKFLLGKGASIDAANKEGITPLHTAVIKGHVEIVKHLLKKGANPNLSAKSGAFPIHSAVLFNQLEALKVLLESPLVEKNQGHSVTGQTAVILSVLEDRPETLEFLITDGHDLDRPDRYGMTPLLHAVKTGQADLLKILLDHKANARTRAGGLSALQLAERLEDSENKEEIVEMLQNNEAPHPDEDLIPEKSSST